VTPIIGTSGWSYEHWNDVLYPAGTAATRRLGIYVEQFPTVEQNASFYRWPSASTFASWKRRLPDGFTMSVKAPRGLTHAKRLYAPEEWVSRIAAGWHELGNRRGMLLVQLPPAMERDDLRLDYFLSLLPDWIEVAVELRHSSWDHEAVYEILEARGAAYCVVSGANIGCHLRATADTVYVRLHGPDRQHLYAGSYSDAELGWWAQRIREWEESDRRVLVYFNNDGDGNAVRNASTLLRLLQN
jgi:uncharacterized protein YecE (DUF72 family)